ncbi:MAG: twin-arginine translocase TatA/TatE family subunit [Methyloceanibacter sp.]|jgi:sec-independent protein translocase protein TatA
MAPSWWQILIVLVLFVLLFGRGKISDLMGDVAKGIKSFKTGLADDGEEKSDPKVISQEGEKPPAAKSAPRAKAPRSRKSS